MRRPRWPTGLLAAAFVLAVVGKAAEADKARSPSARTARPARVGATRAERDLATLRTLVMNSQRLALPPKRLAARRLTPPSATAGAASGQHQEVSLQVVVWR